MTTTVAERWLYQQGESPAPTLYNTTDNDPDLRATTGSPSSAAPEDLTDRPDISVVCDLCDLHIDLKTLADHRRFHEALEVMKYKGNARPETIPKLMQRRRAILRKMNSMLKPDDSPIDSDIVHRINDAYEFLKADLEETYETFRKIKNVCNTEVQGVAVNSDVGCILAVGMCSAANSRWKSVMEDTYKFQDSLGGDVDKAFLGLYDGHHGPYAAERAAEELHHALLYEMVKFDPKMKWTQGVANKAHTKCDYSEFEWTDDDKLDEEENTPGDNDNDVCAIYQVIKGYEERLERAKRLKENIKEGDKAEEKDPEITQVDTQINRHNEESENTGNKRCRKKYTNEYSEKVEEAMKQAYKFTDMFLSWGKEEQSRTRWSGCSAFTALIEYTENQGEQEDKAKSEEHKETKPQDEPISETPKELGRLHLAHAGNVSCVLVRGNQTYRLTKDHTPRNPKERARVERLGGTISESNRDIRVNGVIPSTRGLGNHGDKLLKDVIAVTPYTTVVPLDEYVQFLIIASQGVWDVFSEEEAAHLLLQMLPCNQLPPPSRIATSIQYLLAAKGRSQSVDTSHIPASELVDRLRSISGMTAASVPLPDHLKHLGGPSPDLPRRRQPIFSDSHGLGDLPEHDMHTEIGSDDGLAFNGDEDGESGNEADVDTNLDQYTVPAMSRMSLAPPPCREDIQREFAQVLSERLVQAAMMAGSKDNVSAMVVLLPGCGL